MRAHCYYPSEVRGGDTGRAGYIKLTRTVQSWDLPADVDMEDAWYPFYPLPTDSVHGDSKEVHLDIRVTNLNVDH